MLNGVHGQSRKGFDVDVAMMDRMDVFVQPTYMYQAMSEIEMNVPKGWNPHGQSQQEENRMMSSSILVLPF
jgi:hypothetical protein